MISLNSVEAYNSIPDLHERQRKVYACIVANPRMSSNDIARATGMNPMNVRNRITELLNDGQIIVCGKKRDRITGRTVRQYEKVENPHVVRWAEAEA